MDIALRSNQNDDATVRWEITINEINSCTDNYLQTERMFNRQNINAGCPRRQTPYVINSKLKRTALSRCSQTAYLSVLINRSRAMRIVNSGQRDHPANARGHLYKKYHKWFSFRIKQIKKTKKIRKYLQRSNGIRFIARAQLAVAVGTPAEDLAVIRQR